MLSLSNIGKILVNEIKVKGQTAVKQIIIRSEMSNEGQKIYYKNDRLDWAIQE